MSFPQPNGPVPLDVNSHVMLPVVFTHLLWMLWWMSMVEVVTSSQSTQESLAGRAMGDHTANVLLWCLLYFTSYGGGLAWVGWYTCPMHDGCLYTREHQPLT